MEFFYSLFLSFIFQIHCILDEDNRHTGESEEEIYHDKSYNLHQFRTPHHVKSISAVSPITSRLKRAKSNAKSHEREHIKQVPMMSPLADFTNDTEQKENASFIHQMDCKHGLTHKAARTNRNSFRLKRKKHQDFPAVAFSRFKKEKNSLSFITKIHRKRNKSPSLLDETDKQSAKHDAANKNNREIASVFQEETDESSSSNALMTEHKGLKKKETTLSKDSGSKLPIKRTRFDNKYKNKQKRKEIVTTKKYRKNVDEYRYKRTKELDIKKTGEASYTKRVPYKKTVKKGIENKELKNEISRRRASKHACECHNKDEPIKRENGDHMENPNTQTNEARTVVNILDENVESTHSEQREKTTNNHKYIKSKRNKSNGEKEIAQKDTSMNDSDMIRQSNGDVKVGDEWESVSENAQTMSDFQKQLSDEVDDNYKYLQESVDSD